MKVIPETHRAHYPSGAPEFITVFSGVRVTQSLVLYVYFVDRCLSFCTFLLPIVLSVLLRYTDSDCPFGIFKLFLLKLEFNFFLNPIVQSHSYCPDLKVFQDIYQR